MNFIFSAIRNIIIGITLGVSLSFALMSTRALSGWPSINPAVPTITSSGGFLMTEFEKILVDTSVTTDGKVKQTKNLDGLPLASYQKRITGYCSASNPIVEIKTDGSVVCLDKVVVDTCAIAPDITLPNGQVWQACNIGATSTIPTDVRSYGNYYQWGRNNTGFTLPAKGLAGYDWQDHNDNAWGDTTNTEIARQGPCSVGYHVPTRTEWSQVNTQGLVNTLKLPKAGSNQYAGLPPYTGPVPSGHGISGHYWSSTPYPGSPGYFDAAYNFDNSGALINGNARAIAFPIRCIKNTTPPVPTGGILYCWGSNGQGQLGITDGLPKHARPTQVSTGSTFQSVSAGTMYTCALNTAGKAFCWGDNMFGQLGNGTAGVGGPVIQQVVGTGGTVARALTYTSIVTAFRSVCALDTRGKAFCWGAGSEGALGNNSTSFSYAPTPVHGPDGTLTTALTFDSIYAGGKTHKCGLTSSGKAYCWGGNPIGQLGNGTTSNSLFPKAVVGPDGTIGTALTFTKLVLGGSATASMTGYTCGLTTSGEIYCWGGLSYSSDMSSDSLGDSFVKTISVTIPTLLIDTKTDPKGRAVNFNGGFMHYCYTRADGSTACQGSNGYQELGNPITMNTLGGIWGSFVESPSFGIYRFVGITTGLYHTCGLSSTGLASCWGWDQPNYGLRGTDDPAVGSDIGIPAPVIGPTENPGTPLNFSAITAGTLHTCAITGTPTPLPPIIPSTNVCTLDATLDCVLPM